MFIGWENGPALAEEARDPKRTIPRAIYISVAIGAALFVTFAYATVTGFGYDVSSIGRSSIPFLAVADQYLGGGRNPGVAHGNRLRAGDARSRARTRRRACCSTGAAPGCSRHGSAASESHLRRR